MANGRILISKPSGGVTTVTSVDGAGNTNLVLPESGTLATTAGATETSTGLIELATAAEAQVGTDDSRAITPLKLRNALNANGTAPIYACRAWVNFNGTGTVAIRASGNVSSITDNGVNDYTINFTTAMPDKYYTLSGAAQYNQDNLVTAILSYRGHQTIDNYILTTSCRIATKMTTSSGYADVDCLAISASFTR